MTVVSVQLTYRSLLVRTKNLFLEEKKQDRRMNHKDKNGQEKNKSN